MKHSFFLVIALLALLAAPVAAQEASPVASPTMGAPSAVASGLVNPRGFLWTDDGTLFVAQAGTGGTTLGTPEVAPPLGPFHGGSSASIVRIDNGCPVLVAGELPSVVFTTGEVLGAEDLAVLGDQLYASVDGGGESHGNAAQPSGVYRILENGSTELVADLSAWVRANPVALLPPDHDPDAAGFSLVADPTANAFWVDDPNSGQILNVGLDGTVTRVVDLSDPHRVPTGLAVAPQGGVYVGFLTPVPFPDGASSVIHVAPDGTVTEVWSGLTAVTGVAVGPDGTLYASEMTTGNLEEPPFAVPGSGRIVHQTGPRQQRRRRDRADVPDRRSPSDPTADLYVSLPAVGADGGTGTISRIDLTGSAEGTSTTTACSPVGAATPVT